MNLAHSATLRTCFGGWADEKIEPVHEAAPNVLLGRPGDADREISCDLVAVERAANRRLSFFCAKIWQNNSFSLD